MAGYLKPIPVTDAVTKNYWQGCSKQELLLQKCSNCGHLQFYPRICCIKCMSQNLEWVRSSGRGTVHTFTMVHQNVTPGFAKEVPYVYAIVELTEGVRLTTNIVECVPNEVYIGMPVSVVFEPISPEINLPKFKPNGNANQLK
jgi:uncharacterized OB-fold protein